MKKQQTSLIRQLENHPRVVNLPCKLSAIGCMFRHSSHSKHVSNLFFCLTWNRWKYNPDCEEACYFSIIYPDTWIAGRPSLPHDEIWLSYPPETAAFFSQILPPGIFNWKRGENNPRFRKKLMLSLEMTRIIHQIYDKLDNFFLPGSVDALDLLALQLIEECVIPIQTERSQYTENDLKIMKLAGQLKNGVPLPELIRSYGFSRRNFYLAWNRIYKISPIQFKLQENLQMAADLLRRTELPISEIAGMCSFNSTIYFYNQFRRFYKMTPRQYREQHFQD